MSSSIRPKVLCVDNDEDSREMLSTLLGLSRIEAKAIGTASEALSLIQVERFDLYTLDAWLPKVDGFELCRRMRDFDPHTPILFFSGAPDEADEKKGFEAGANAYLIKPDIHGLVRSIKQLTSFAEGDAIRVIPAERRVDIPLPFNFESTRTFICEL